MSDYFRDITEILTNKEDVSEMLEYFRLNENFNLPIGFESYGIYDLKDESRHISLKKGDIIGIGSMSYMDLDKKNKTINLCFHKNHPNPTKVSKEFFVVNNHIFKNITTEILRDKKINKILN